MHLQRRRVFVDVHITWLKTCLFVRQSKRYSIDRQKMKIGERDFRRCIDLGQDNASDLPLIGMIVFDVLMIAR